MSTKEFPIPVAAEGRECGTCTMCCKLLKIEELDKPQGSWCPNCVPTSGCKIHDSVDLPKSCGEFLCIWRQHLQIPDKMRPDRVKAIMTSTTDGMNMVIHGTDPGLENTPIWFRDWLLEKVLQKMDVIVVCGDKRTYFKKD